jgi:predicted HAD superfamily phosphohydrolase
LIFWSKNIKDKIMKIKKNGEVINLTESDLKRIVEHSNRLDEGLGRNIMSRFKGIGGAIRGTGYSYTKYAYQLSGAINELNEELEETKKELNKVIDKSNKSRMSNVAYDRLSKHVADAMDAYQMVIDTNEIIMEDLDASVTNQRDEVRPSSEPESQFTR